MNGTKVFLDTNALIAYLKGNQHLYEMVQAASWVGTSAICVIEFLSFTALSLQDKALFLSFISNIHVDGINTETSELETIANFKKQHRLKLPDAVIAAQALAAGATLLSNDRHFQNIPHINVLSF